MKIIISHDIDHLSVKEHISRDLIIPKYIFWSFFELIKRKNSLNIFFRKIIGLFRKRAWNNLKELLEFDKKNKINPTFFVAVNKGKGISYSQKQAKEAINLIKKYNFDIGLHGICFDNLEGIKKEQKIFQKVSGLNNFGIRMHYLRLSKETLRHLAGLGYLFDTSILSGKIEQEYKINGIIEIPFHIMDSYLLGPQSKLNLEEAKKYTIGLLDKADKENKKYFAILFHQNYFSDEFPQYKDWYNWLINYCKERNYEFINYRNLL